jgi:adenosine deaminase
MSDRCDYQFVKHQLPKVELHAHLNGCIPVGLLHQLATERGVRLASKHFGAAPPTTTTTEKADKQSIDDQQQLLPDMYNVRPRSLQDCFDMFAALPAVVNDLDAVRRISVAALQQFSNHHTAYLELRSTPKRLLRDFRCREVCSKQEYVETILSVLRDFEEQECLRYHRELQDDDMARLPMVCRFIVSVDRSQSLEEATENIELAIQMKRKSAYVVGVDLGGNPTKNDFRAFSSLFQRAREEAFLKVTIHCAEIPCDEGTVANAEAAAILQFRPDRLGHAVLLPETLLRKLEDSKIPVETCPTSNVMTLELHHHDDKRSEHHGNLVRGLQQHEALNHWMENQHPIAICTDDPGVFDTTITQEMWLLVTAFALSTQKLADLVVQSVDHAFCDATVKKQVQEKIRLRVDAVLKHRLPSP